MNKSHHKGSQRLISVLQDSGCYVKNGVYASKWLQGKKNQQAFSTTKLSNLSKLCILSLVYIFLSFLFLKYLWLVEFSMYFLTRSPGFQNLVRCYRDMVKKNASINTNPEDFLQMTVPNFNPLYHRQYTNMD